VYTGSMTYRITFL